MDSKAPPPAALPTAAATIGERRLRALVGLAVMILMVACGSAPKRPSSAHAPPSSRAAGNHAQLANAVVFRAIALVGTPYRWGGNTPDSGFDCSGLVGYVFRDAAGVSLPRTSRAISEINAPKVKRKQLTSGDLVFFASGRRVDHVGIYVGDGRFVHAPNRGGTVRLDELNGHYWRDHFQFGRRPLR